MINDELNKIWNSSSKVEKVKFEKSRLILELQSNMDNLHKRIRFRDLREIVAAIIVIPIFIYYAIIIPYLISKIASILIVVWACYVIYKLRQVNNNKPSDYHENYLIYLEKNKEYLREQKELLDNIFWWYIAPFLFCMSLFVIGFLGDSNQTNWVITTLVVGGVLSVIIYIINKRASKNEYDGRISKIENLIKIMKSTET